MLNYLTILFKLKTSISQMEDSSNWHKTYYNSLLATICLWRFRCCIKKKCFARIRIPLRSGSVPFQKTNTVRNRNNEKTGTGTLCGLGEKNPAIWRRFFLLLFWVSGEGFPLYLTFYSITQWSCRKSGSLRIPICRMITGTFDRQEGDIWGPVAGCWSSSAQ